MQLLSNCSSSHIRVQFTALLVASLCLLSSITAVASEPLKVFVSILPQKQFVERVGGDAVRVEVMVRPGQSPATYEPTPQQMVSLAEADVYFQIGAPFENTWIPKIEQTHPALKVFDTREGIILLPMIRADGRAPVSDGKSSGLDPHIWTSPRLVRQQAANIRDGLIALRPADRARFEAGYQGYAEALNVLDREITNLLSGKAERRFMVFHPAWGYFADDYELEQMPIEVEGKEPSPKALVEIIERARRHQIRAIFVQKQFSRNAAEQVARAIDGEVVSIDPLAEDFVSNTRAIARTLGQALR